MGVDAERQLMLQIDDPLPIPAAPPPRGRERRDNADGGVQDGRGTTRAGRKPDSFYRLAVGAAVLHLNDRASLECNALAQLTTLRRLADERYPGQNLAQGPLPARPHSRGSQRDDPGCRWR